MVLRSIISEKKTWYEKQLAGSFCKLLNSCKSNQNYLKGTNKIKIVLILWLYLNNHWLKINNHFKLFSALYKSRVLQELI